MQEKSRKLAVNEGYGSGRCASQVQREVVDVTLMHYFNPNVGVVDDVRPAVDHMAITVEDGVVEVEAIEIEGEAANGHTSKPDAYYRPCPQEEVQGTTIIEGGILENEPAEIAMGCYNVISLFFLAEFVPIVLGLGFGGFADQRGGYQTAVHSRE